MPAFRIKEPFFLKGLKLFEGLCGDEGAVSPVIKAAVLLDEISASVQITNREREKLVHKMPFAF